MNRIVASVLVVLSAACTAPTVPNPSYRTVTLTEPTAPPMTVKSTAMVANLNAQLVGGKQASDFAPATGSAEYAPATGSTAYAPATGSTAYAPATGSPAYAPATDSPNYLAKAADGSVTVSGALHAGVFQLVQSGTVTDAATIEIDHLDGDTDVEYQVEVQGHVTATADEYVIVRPQVTDGDWETHQVRFPATAQLVTELFGNNHPGFFLARTVYSASGDLSARAHVFAQSGFFRQSLTRSEFYASPSQNGNTSATTTWADSTTDITSLTIDFGTATFTGRWRLFALR